MATDLGKVGIRMRGTWDSSTAYEVLDAVYYQTGTYIAKQAVPANTLPTNTTYWQAALVPTIQTLTYVNDNIITQGIITTSLNLIAGSIRIDKITPNYGLITMMLALNNGSDGLAMARTTLFTINPAKLTVYYAAGLARDIKLDAAGNANTAGNSLTAAIDVSGFYNESSGVLQADLQKGIYSPDSLLSNGNLKCITVRMFAFCKINNL